jgi:hypothetical protein
MDHQWLACVKATLSKKSEVKVHCKAPNVAFGMGTREGAKGREVMDMG